MVKFLFSSILTLCCFLSFGQELNLSKAPLSTGDQKKEFVSIGLSNSNEIVLIDTQHKIWKYDGNTLVLWSEKPLEKASFFDAIYLEDSLLFIRIEDVFLSYSEKDDKPSRYQKPIPSSHPIRSLSKKRSIDNVGEYFYTYNNRVVWRDTKDNKTLAELMLSNHSNLIVDAWNTKWLLYENKLYFLLQERARIIQDAWKIENSAPTRLFIFKDKTISVYPAGRIRVREKASTWDIEYTHGAEISKIFVDNSDRVWLIDKGLKLSLINKDKSINSWTSDVTGITEIPININLKGDILHVIQPTRGVLQAKIAVISENYIWLSHRLNRKIVNTDIISACYDEVQFLFTRSQGVISLDNKALGKVASPREKWEIKAAKHTDKYSIILDAGKRWYVFDRKHMKIEAIVSKALPPEIESKDFLIEKDIILYKSDGKLVKLDIETGDWFIQSCDLPFTHAFIVDNSIREYYNDKLTIFYPQKQQNETEAPLLSTVEVKTSNGKAFNVYPATDFALELETADYPLSFWAKANYLKEPASIEYAWQWNGGESYDKDFSFEEEVRLRTKYVGSILPKLTVSNGRQEKDYVLREIRTSKSQFQDSNKWAIYLSGVLAALLLAVLVGSRVRSRGQSRKISALQAKQKLTEMEQKALQLQMNPHFIFNALNGVKGMIAMGDSKKARQYLTKVSGWMRNMLHDARSTSIQLSQEVENLEIYLQIEQELRGNKWEYFIDHEDVDTTLHIPPMMIQPFVENAIVHAFNDGRDGIIYLRFSQKGRRLIVEVEDNGSGRKVQQKQHKSVALELIQERLRYMNKGSSMEQYVLIDKSIKEHGETGVIVKIVLPLIQHI